MAETIAQVYERYGPLVHRRARALLGDDHSVVDREGRAAVTLVRAVALAFACLVAAGSAHMFDVGVLALGIGLEGGLGWMAQRFTGPPTVPRDGLAGFVAPVVELELPIRRRYYARLDGAFDVYFLGAQATPGVTTQLSWRATLGAGAWF